MSVIAAPATPGFKRPSPLQAEPNRNRLRPSASSEEKQAGAVGRVWGLVRRSSSARRSWTDRDDSSALAGVCVQPQQKAPDPGCRTDRRTHKHCGSSPLSAGGARAHTTIVRADLTPLHVPRAARRAALRCAARRANPKRATASIGANRASLQKTARGPSRRSDRACGTSTASASRCVPAPPRCVRAPLHRGSVPYAVLACADARVELVVGACFRLFLGT
eukprot:5594114-Prymnesium_polylepis.1